MADVPHVILLMYPYAGLDRGMLRGIVRYARAHGPWTLHLAGEEPGLPLPEVEAFSSLTQRKRGRESFLRSTLRAVPEKDSRPLFREGRVDLPFYQGPRM